MLLLLLKILAVALSVALAAGILARDHELLANRLVSAFFLCNAWWAGCEFLVFQSSDPALAATLFRWMSVGWLPLGALCLHSSLCVSSMRDHPVSRFVPLAYVSAALSMLLSVGTELVFADVSGPVGNWRPVFGPLFGIAYASMAIPLVTILACWGQVMRLPGHRGLRALARIIFVGVSGSMVMGTVTGVVFPTLGWPAMGLTTTLLSMVGVAAAWTLHRYGYSLISPEAYAREIFETLDDGVVVVGERGRIRDMNPAFARLAGHTESGLLGKPMAALFPELASERADSDLEEARFLDLCSRQGRRVPVVLSGPVPIVVRNKIHGEAFVVRDRREIVSLQRQLAVSGRLAAVGDLSKSISESIRQPSAATRDQLEALRREWRAMQQDLSEAANAEAMTEGLELIDECLGGIDRVDSIVDEVGRFGATSRQGSLDGHDLSEIVSDALRMARVQADPRIEIEARLDPKVCVMCFRPELERVVTNVLVNAFHALEGRVADPGGAAHLAVAVVAQGSRALLHVEDDGCGIAPEVLDRVFDPFFTTKPVGQGTGLGLAISYHILRKHGGEIRISSVENGGTSVAIELPRTESD